jgi:DNA uptake protein ComE-like DNA-binding protein
MKLKKFLWDYLYFTQIERYGIVFLLAFCLALLAVPRFYFRFFAHHDDNLATPAQAQPVGLKTEIPPEHNAKTVKLFHFNPNTATLDDFIALGLSEKTAKSILNYRSKGGSFRKPEDLAKIYTLPPSDFQRLQPWISLQESKPEAPDWEKDEPAIKPANDPVTLTKFDPNLVTNNHLKELGLPPKTISGWLNYLEKGGRFRFKEDIQRLYSLSESDYSRLLPLVLLPSKTETASAPATYSGGYSKKAPVAAIDINNAETTQWVNLPGIGEGWARKILGWRDRLGGFVTVDQVAETRYLPDSIFQKAKPYLICPPPEIRRISINTADFQTLNEHPYIEAKHARWIVAYREQHGQFRNLDDLLKIPELKPDWLAKIRPYLSVGVF